MRPSATARSGGTKRLLRKSFRIWGKGFSELWWKLTSGKLSIRLTAAALLQHVHGDVAFFLFFFLSKIGNFRDLYTKEELYAQCMAVGLYLNFVWLWRYSITTREIWNLGGEEATEEAGKKLSELREYLRVQQSGFMMELGMLLNSVLDNHVPKKEPPKRKKAGETPKKKKKKQKQQQQQRTAGHVSSSMESGMEDLPVGEEPPFAISKDIMERLVGQTVLSMANDLIGLECVAKAAGVREPKISMERVLGAKAELLRKPGPTLTNIRNRK